LAMMMAPLIAPWTYLWHFHPSPMNCFESPTMAKALNLVL